MFDAVVAREVMGFRLRVQSVAVLRKNRRVLRGHPVGMASDRPEEVEDHGPQPHLSRRAHNDEYAARSTARNASSDGPSKNGRTWVANTPATCVAGSIQ